MFQAIANLYRTIFDEVSLLGDIPNFLIRVSIGLVFANTGWGKIHSIPDITGYFTSLGIPFPEFNAVLVGYTELIAGALLVIGLLTRLSAIPLAITMAVAIITAYLPEVKDIFGFFRLLEWAYFLIFIWLIIIGPGKLSSDHFLTKKFLSNS
ncbi:MAG: DoxX family protein [Candidatus Caenarcaniphilales bacterium]|nr:DoxX family protein [Candidatus Caenarcaniphilales bacterium]